MIDVRSPTIGPTRPRSPERRASQKRPRDTEEDRPELGPPGNRSRFTEEAVLGNGERRSTRNADVGMPGHEDRTGQGAQTSSRYNLAPERGAEWSAPIRSVPAIEDDIVGETANMMTDRSSGYRSLSERRMTDDKLRSPAIRRKIVLDGDSDENGQTSGPERSTPAEERRSGHR